MVIMYKAEILLAAARKGVSLMAVILCLLVLNVIMSHAVGNAASGQADKVFDKAFLQSVKDVLTYEQIVRIVSVLGEKVGSNSLKIPGDKYHWNGRENSSFNIRVSSGRLVDANVVTPDGRILSIEGNGEVIDFGK